MSSWGLGWKRTSEVFHLTLSYGADADTLEDVTPTSSRSSSPFPGSPSGSSPDTSAAAVAAATKSLCQGDQLGFRIELDWNAGEDEDQVALKLQSQVMIALPSPHDKVEIEFKERDDNWENDGEGNLWSTGVGVEMKVVKRKEPLKGVIMWRSVGSGQLSDGGMGVLVKLMRSNFATSADGVAVVASAGCPDHWRNVTIVSLCALGLTVSRE